MFLLKNFENLSEPGITVSETCTSQHDSPRISEMFLLFKNNYRNGFVLGNHTCCFGIFKR